MTDTMDLPITTQFPGTAQRYLQKRAADQIQRFDNQSMSEAEFQHQLANEGYLSTSIPIPDTDDY